MTRFVSQSHPKGLPEAGARRTVRILPRSSWWLAAGLAAAVSLVPDTVAHAGKTLYVASHGVDSFFCGTKSSPCRSIGVTILLASEGDRIVVGPGFYGDLNDDGVLIGLFTGEEFERDGCGCMILVDKRLTIESRAGAAATFLDTGSAAIEVVAISADKVTFGKKEKGFTLTGGIGVRLDGPPSGVTVSGNRISLSRPESGVPNAAIWGGGPKLTVSHNVVSNDGALLTNGVSAIASGGNGARFVRNVVTRGSGPAFDLGGDRLKILDNVAVHNAGFGLFIKRTTSATLIRGNTLTGNGGPGMHFGDSQPGIVITKNNIFGNGGNCGLSNTSGTTITGVTKNFWGAASGPGPDPADAICDLGPVSPTTDLAPAASPYPVNATAGR